MRIKKAFWASLALAPASIIPLSTATSCSQAWGYKTPISIGSSIKGSALDPFAAFTSHTSLVDLNGDQIVPQLQSNFAIDVKSNNFYGYSLPEKWNEEVQDSKHPVKEETSAATIAWEKGTFEEGSAAWYDQSSSDFVKSKNLTGERTIKSTSKKSKVNETVYSYRNNTLQSVIQMVGYIGSTINSCVNYALQYQGTQIGTEYSANNENLLTAWGGKSLNHGTIDSVENRTFFESIFASNAVSGTGKSKAAMHPTHVQFTFNGNTFPIPAYKALEGKITGVNDATLKLLNGSTVRPSSASTQYWSSVSDIVKEENYNIRTDKKDTFEYKVYTYTNVPVIVYLNAATKSFVNPTKKSGYNVSDFYSETKDIKDAIGSSWEKSLPKFATNGKTEPTYCAYSYIRPSAGGEKKIALTGDKWDKRLNPDDLTQTSFVVLLNYAYKEYKSASDGSDPASLDRVTMTGINTVFPSYFIDPDVKLKETAFFEPAINKPAVAPNPGYIINSSKINKFNNLFFELLKRSSGQGLVTEAKNLNDVSKELLKFLAYMFGDSSLAVDTTNMIIPFKLN